MESSTNWIQRLYPTTKAWLTLAIILCAMFFKGFYFQYAIFIVFAVISLFSGVLSHYLSLFFKSIFVICLFIFIMQVFLVYHDKIIWSWGILHASNTGLQTSLLMTSKIVAIGSVLIWFFQATQVKDITKAMQLAGWNKKLIFVILSTMQLIPQMQALTKTISDAQESRGVETQGGLWTRIKSFIPMLGPVVLTSIEQNEERVLTLQSRSFSSKQRPSLMYPIKKTKLDYLLTVVIIISFCVSFYWEVFK